jgi:spore coat protein CotH
LYRYTAVDANEDVTDDVGARLLLDALDVPAVINEMAAQTLVLSIDRCTKNYYVHRDRKTLEWSRIPWDLEDSFPVVGL